MSYFKIRFNIVLVSVTFFQILLLQFCINFFSLSSQTAQSESLCGEVFCKTYSQPSHLIKSSVDTCRGVEVELHIFSKQPRDKFNGHM